MDLSRNGRTNWMSTELTKSWFLFAIDVFAIPLRGLAREGSCLQEMSTESPSRAVLRIRIDKERYVTLQSAP